MKMIAPSVRSVSFNQEMENLEQLKQVLKSLEETDEYGKYMSPLASSLWVLFRNYMIKIRKQTNFLQDEEAWKMKFREDIGKPYNQQTESMQYWICQLSNTGR